MNPAARRPIPLLALAALLFAATFLPAATSTPTRPAGPARPAGLALTKLNGADYVKLADAARHLGYTGSWVTTGQVYRLTSGTRRVEFKNNSRETSIDGARLFLGSPILARGRDLYVSKIDVDRLLAGLLRPALVSPRVARPKTIVIDAGHGGNDPGKENLALKLQEKDLTLDIAKRIGQILQAAGYTVKLTRTDDRRLGPDQQADLRARSQFANNAAADLFVSIHLNAESDPKTSGPEIYTFTAQNQRTSGAWGIGQKNDAQATAAAVNRYDAWSAALAHAVHRELLASLKTSDRGQKNNHLGVLRGLDCPGILVESLFLTNETEARRAANPQYRQQIAEAIAAGIERYADAVEAAGRPGGK